MSMRANGILAVPSLEAMGGLCPGQEALECPWWHSGGNGGIAGVAKHLSDRRMCSGPQCGPLTTTALLDHQQGGVTKSSPTIPNQLPQHGTTEAGSSSTRKTPDFTGGLACC